MGYQNRLSILRQSISKIIKQEYNRYKLKETPTERQMLNRIKGRIWNSFNCEVLYEKEYKEK